MINMSAGQAMMSPSCLRELSRQMETTIYYPPYWDLEETVLGQCQELLATQAEVLLVAGSATYGEEAAMRSMLQPGERVVVVSGGVFGAVASALLRIIGCEPIEVATPFGAPLELARVEEALAGPPVRAMMAVAVETSTGTRYPIEQLGALARRHGALFMVDAISALVAAEFRMDEWGVDVCFASPQKCISGPQGVAIVAVSRRAWEAVESNPRANTSLCLDLSVWRRYHEVKVKAMNRAWREGKPQPRPMGRAPHEVSPSGPVVRGLHGALDDIFAEGLAHVRRRHQVCSAAVRAAVRALGLRLVAGSDEIAAPSVTVAYLPAGVYERDFRAYLMQETGVVVANGEIGDDNIRIGTMGWGAQKHFVLTTLQALEKALAHFGWRFKPGCGVAAGRAAFSAAPDIDWDRVPKA